ncbi:MAG: patatin-like phospholipase family protein [Muribaculaceae bacterium]|nr:patatin-like phospholipase family protein [Muribaculaceae bacterium]
MLPALLKAQAHQSVGLVLSGGGAKGIAHIGLIQALEDNDIPIDYITGTSMGAIVGGLYACGYTPAEMMELINSDYFGYLSSGKADPAFTYYFSKGSPSPQMFAMSVGGRDSTARSKIFNPQSLISPMPMSFGFMQIFSAYGAQCGGNFDRLFVPFRCVASDVAQKRKKVMGAGDLGESIRASMSFPLIFQATEIDGQVLYDGGIYDNFPVGVMQTEFAPSVIIGSDVSAPSDGPANSYFQQLDLLVSRAQSYEVPPETGIKVRIDVSNFGLLDWDRADAIYRAGYSRGIEMMDSIKARIPTRADSTARRLRRAVFKSGTPALRFDSVNVEGATKRQNEYIKYLFHPAKGTDTIGIDRARLAFYRALSSGKMSYLRPRAHVNNDSAGLFTLDLKALVKSNFSVGAGAYITSSNNSYLYLRGGYSSLSFSSVSTDIEAWIGQSYMAGALTGRLDIASTLPSALVLKAVASRRKYYEDEELFFRDNEPAFVTAHEYFAKLAWAMAAGRSGCVDIGLGGGKLRNTFYSPGHEGGYREGRHHVDFALGQAYAAYRSSTLDNINYPLSGSSLNASFAAVLGKATCGQAGADGRGTDKHMAWLQLDAHWRNYISLGRHWVLGTEARALLSNRPLPGSYEASVSSAPAYSPTPASTNTFNPAFRANSFLAATVVPVYKFNSSLSARFSASVFAPLRGIREGDGGTARFGRCFDSTEFFGELNLVYALPFGNIAGYCNYSSSPGKFHGGISFGIYLPAPSFL